MFKPFFPQSLMSESHPNQMRCSTDNDYARFGNKLLNSLHELRIPDVSNDELQEIAEVLTLYYEDVVSDVGVWQTFTHKMKELYNRPVPFYDTDSKPYYDDEPNEADICFLIWNTFLGLRPDKIENPINPAIFDMARVTLQLMDDDFEQMPINEELKDFFAECSFADDFYTMRDVEKWVMADCFLTRNLNIMMDVASTFMESDTEELGEETMKRMFYTEFVHRICFTKMGPLALYAKEWLAAIMHHNGAHKAAKLVEQQEERELMPYSAVVINDEYEMVDVRGKVIRSRIADFEFLHNSKERKRYIFGEFVKYDNRWMPNGSVLQTDSPEKMEEEKKKRKQEAHAGVPNYKKLLKQNDGSPLFYFKDYDALLTFEKDVMGLKGLDSPNLVCPAEYRHTNWTLFLPAADKGFDAYPDIADCICDPHNPFYNSNVEPTTVLDMAISIDSDLLFHCMKHNLLPNAGLKSRFGKEAGIKVVQDNFDFVMRALRRENY